MNLKSVSLGNVITIASILLGTGALLARDGAQTDAITALSRRIDKMDEKWEATQRFTTQVEILLDRWNRSPPSLQRPAQHQIHGPGASRLPSLGALAMLTMAAPPPNDVGEYEEEHDVEQAPPPRPREVTPDDVREVTRRLARINKEESDRE